MSLAAFVDDLDAPAVSLQVADLDGPGDEHVLGMLEDLFERQAVDVDRVTADVDDEHVVALARDGERVATSTLAELGEAVLFVNSDTYVTGSRSLEDVRTPAVLEALADVPFRAEGYPSTRKEKFLLIELSRSIEARAYRAGTGRIHSGFQRLSRIDDERGTREVYETLASTTLDVNVYGLGDREFDAPLSVHSASEELGEVWFVVYVPPDAPDAQHAALVCVETDAGHWRGCWTFDAWRVRDVERYVVETFQG